jgi:2-polyprenyl-3-methyl-5-hydroxy-6-metoxy-1,4-benzoquinol methylase
MDASEAFPLVHAPCPLCGEDSSIRVWETPDRLCGCPGLFTVVRCVRCDLMRQEPMVPPTRIRDYYPGDYIVYNRENPARVGAGRTEPWRRDWLRLISGEESPSAIGSPAYRFFLRLFSCSPQARYNPLAFRNPGSRLLDVGCGIGNFAVEMKALGWDVQGIEIDAQAAERARERGLQVVTGSFPEVADQLRGPYDAVTMNQVIEHMADPGPALRCARDLLKPGGLLVIWTPWRDGLAARIFGPYWFALEQPRHYVLFTKRHLMRMAEKSGFITAAVLDHSSTASWTRSLAYRFTSGRFSSWAKGADQKKWVHRILNVFTRVLDMLGLGDGGVAVLKTPK